MCELALPGRSHEVRGPGVSITVGLEGHVCVCVCVCVCEYVCTYTCGSQSLSQVSFLRSDLFCFLRQDFRMAQGSLVHPGWLAREPQRPSHLCLPSTGITVLSITLLSVLGIELRSSCLRGKSFTH